MAGISFQKAPEAIKAPMPATVGLGRLRKIALVGTASSIRFAPWEDRTWEIWAHASSRALCERVDRYFDLHPQAFWTKPKKWDPSYLQWLTRQPVPIYMQDRFAEVPMSIRYPRERVLTEFRRYFTSHAAWMTALALMEGVTHLGFFGIHYSSDSEYASQRSGCEYWMGLAEGRGVQLVLPEGNPLLRTPSRLYAYESHDDGQLHESYRWSPKVPHVDTPKGPQALTVLSDDPNAPRIPLRRDLDEPPAWERSGHPLPQLQRDGTFTYF